MSQQNELVPYVEASGEPATPRVLPYTVTGYGSTLPVLRAHSWSRSAIVAFILLCLIPWSAGLTSVPAIILAHLGLRDTRAGRRRGRMLSILAMIGGCLTLAAYAAIIILALSFSHPI